MEKFKRFIVPLIICAVLLMVAVGLWSYFEKNNSKPDYFAQQKAGLNRLLKNSSEIQRIWEEAEDSREWSLVQDQCFKDLGLSQKFDLTLLRCNPILLECIHRFGKNLPFKLKSFEEFDGKIYRQITKSNSSYRGLSETGINLTLMDDETNQSLQLFLVDNCHEVYLEQRAYAYGQPPETKDAVDYRFDNFNRHLYLDNRLVANFEINDWITFGNPDFTKGLKKSSGDDLFMPATTLTKIQMENYCSYKGKQLMLAHFFDAATFLPMDMEEKIPKNNQRSPYYWTKKSSDFKPDCKTIYSKNCVNKFGYQINVIGPSWAGLNDSMGGVFEAFRNPIDPDSNLKASSFYFDAFSSWHKLGFRAGWDGEGFQLRNFDFRGLNPYNVSETFKVGFRCMREVLP